MINECKEIADRFDLYTLSKIALAWNLSIKNTHPEIKICGSPERCHYRIVIEGETNQFFVLEKIFENQKTHKHLIAETLEFLSDKGIFEINPYLKTDGCFIKNIENNYWLIRPYVEGVQIQRPDYVFDSWRGRKTADFIIQLWNNTETYSGNNSIPKFSLKDYVIKMKETMMIHHPHELKKIQSVFNYLSFDFFKNYDSVPMRFCHGDYHSLNIIWDKNRIKAVIDWEFLGIKIEIYDMANLLGCLGVEEPISLVRDYALEFIKKIKDSKKISEKSWYYLFDCVLALRFAWLSEWLRKHDLDMIQLEIDYMNLLFENKKKIKKIWDSC